jgi:hypothetical protein
MSGPLHGVVGRTSDRPLYGSLWPIAERLLSKTEEGKRT